MTAKYDSKENCLQEQPDRPKPLYYDAYLACRSANRYLALTLEDLNAIIEYEDHLKSLRTLPCSPEAVNVFKHGGVYTQDVDYKVLGADMWPWCTQLKGSVFAAPLEPPIGEDELWKEVLHFVNNNPGLNDNAKITKLNARFSITKKQ